MRPEVGQVINNKYRLIRLVGDGGMGSVYEARHEVLGTTVALKFLHPELSRRSGLVQRFLQEARVSAHILSPHVVRVSDVDQTSGGLAFIVMEYVQGRTLQALYEDLYRRRTRLAYVDALEYSLQTLDGVEAAHRAGVVHRDLKPDNVMITSGPKGETLLKLLDFGIAKLKVTGEMERGLTRPGVMMGTPEYMAPEQAFSADAVDARADIFSLGVMTFEMLAGRRPVGGDEPHEIAAAYVAGQIAQLTDLVPGIDAKLAAAVHKAMAPEPKDRFSTVAEMRAAIEPAAKAARTPSTATPASQRTPPPVAVPGTTPDLDDDAPPAAAASDEAPRAVPKTLPPEDGPSGEGESAAALQAGGGGTPLGGFSVDSEKPAEESAAAAQASPAEAGPNEAEALNIKRGVAATEPAPEAMAGGVPPTNYEEPAAHHRPGGTAVGAAPLMGETPATVPAEPPAAYAPVAPIAHGYEAPKKKPASSAPSLFSILLLAAGISGAVVGGVYVAHEYAKAQDSGDDTSDLPPAVTFTPTPTPAPTATEPPLEPAPTIDPPIPTNPVPTATSKPTPTATSKPTATATSTGTAPTSTATTTSTGRPTIPTSFPPIIVPSSIPTFTFPFPRPTATATSTGTTPPPKPTATATSTGSTRPRIPILFPPKGN